MPNKNDKINQQVELPLDVISHELMSPNQIAVDFFFYFGFLTNKFIGRDLWRK